MKKLVSAVMLLSLVFSLLYGVNGAQAAAAVTPKLYLNGKLLQSSAEPKVVSQTTLVPIRTVSEGIGFQVSWTGKNVQVSDGNSRNIVLTFDSKTALVNDQTITLDVAATVDKGTTYVPLRFVSEQLGLSVYWDQPTKSVHLYQVDTPTEPNIEPGEPGAGNGADTGTSDGSSGTGGDTNEDGSSDDGVPGSAASATLNAIDYDGLSSIFLSYDGTIGDIKTQLLHSPERIVIDLPNVSFSSSFSPGFTSASKLGEILVDSHVSMQKIRYSLFSDKPETVRIVLDVTTATNYEIAREDGAIRINVLDPVSTGTPTVPTTPTTPDTTDDGIYTVVIDAGHGNHDPGAVANNRKEKDFNLALSLKVKALLDKETKVKGILTRSTDIFLELDERAQFANKAKADLFISIHANKATASASGTETYYYHSYSKSFADIVHKHLLKATGLKDRKVKQSGFAVIKKTTMPAILLESGFISNTTDVSVLFSEAKQNQMAQAIVTGIKEYLKLN